MFWNKQTKQNPDILSIAATVLEARLMSTKSIFVLAIVVLFIVMAWPCESAFAGSIVGWGDNEYGQATPLAGNDYVAVDGGASHSVALKQDGSIVAWGDDGSWGKATPPAGNDFIAIAAGTSHSLALKSDGSIVGWGYNNYGQATPPARNDYVAIAAGRYHSLALKSNGSIVAWGKNDEPPPWGNNFVAIAAGDDFSLALEAEGYIDAWGNNWYGQTTSPAGNDYVAITAGKRHALALKSDGSIVAWGSDEYGQTTSPAGNDYVAIAAGRYHSVALKQDGSIVAWGSNWDGQTTSPAGKYVAIAAGSSHSLAIVPRTFHVDSGATGNNNGSSWANAYNYLQDALAGAVSGDNIWVAQGMYNPDQGSSQTPGDRGATFQLIIGVEIYGGFRSGGCAWEDRDPITYETILSGDLAGNDVEVANAGELLNEPSLDENSEHVVTGGDTDATAVLDGFTITGGSGQQGGGMIISSNPTVNNCTFSGNRAIFGGGLYGGWPTNCTFINNYANEGGGLYEGNPTNCIFIGNSSGTWGGGILLRSTIVTNCTFVGNSSSYEGGGISSPYGGNPMVTNCIFRDNSGPQIYYTGSGLMTVAYSNVQGGWPGTGNIDIDPQFVDLDGPDNIAGTIDDNLRLLPDSLCLNVGDNSVVPSSAAVDMDGNPRIRYGVVDMGAYELQPPSPRTFYVDASADATGYNDGSNWSNAYNYLKDALAEAKSGDEIWVAQGMYKPGQGSSLTPRDREATFRLKSGVAIYGGFPSGGCAWEDRDPIAYETILSGDLAGNDGPDFANYDENSKCVVTGGDTDATAVLDGFTITGGMAPSWGGGMSIRSGSPTVTNCTFRRNRAGTAGGGLYVDFLGGNPTITNCTFINNHANMEGGGLYGGNPTNCTFIGNSARYGGGVSWDYAGIAINCTFIGNSAGSNYRGGGGILLPRTGSPIVTNCTFVGNSSWTNGGGISSPDGGTPTVTNCIFWDNTASSGPQIYHTGSGLMTVAYSNVQGGWPGASNIDIDPRFVDADGPDDIVGTGDDNLRLSPGSPCIDAGDNSAVPPDVLIDIDGTSRFIDDAHTIDTGNGTPPIVDMGAYELVGVPITYHVDGATGDNTNDGLTRDTAYMTIQKGIDTAENGDTVLVWPGQYLESDPSIYDDINFLGKNITLTSSDPKDTNIVNNTVIRGAVLFAGTESPNCTLTGFSIRHLGYGAIYGNRTHATISHCIISGNGPCSATVIENCDGTISNCLITDNATVFFCGVYPVVLGCHGLIKNCTIANNASGVGVVNGGTTIIENCIIYNNDESFTPQLGVSGEGTLNVSYSNVQGGLAGIAGGGTVNWGLGNIDVDPYFAQLGQWPAGQFELVEGDYHLLSEGWRWNKQIAHESHWTYDYVTSRCIDAGNPGVLLADELLTVPDDPTNEYGENVRINMGAFGGTVYASMAPYDWALLADIDSNGTVNVVDLAKQVEDWLNVNNEQPGDLNRDGLVNLEDFVLLAEDWQQETTWAE